MTGNSVESLANAIVETGIIDVRLERRHGTLTGRTWLELNGKDALCHEFEDAILSERVSLNPLIERVLSEHMDPLLQRSIDAASDPQNAAILREELERFQQGKPIYFRLHTYPNPGWDADNGILFGIKKPAASPQS